jgi:hypothetical protein
MPQQLRPAVMHRTSRGAQSVRLSLYHAAFFAGQRFSHSSGHLLSRKQDALITETDQHELSRLLHYRLAALEAALRHLVERRREAAKALQHHFWGCFPSRATCDRTVVIRITTP